MLNKFLIFFIVMFIISLSAMVWAEDSSYHTYSISLEVKVNLPSEEEKFTDLLSLLERRISEMGTITSLITDKNRVDFVFKTELTSERVKYILSKSGMFSVKDESGKETDLGVKYAYYDMKSGHLPALNIILLKDSAGVFAKVTEENIGKKLSMFMDDELVSGHIVREKIPDGRLTITYCAPGPAYHPEDVSAILRNGPLTSEVSILKCEESK